MRTLNQFKTHISTEVIEEEDMMQALYYSTTHTVQIYKTQDNTGQT